MKKNTVFFAMIFNGDHWNDKRYLVISDEMNELGAQRRTMLLRGIAQFQKGIPANIIGGDSMPEESWILMAIKDLIPVATRTEA